jgi:hypothetical protein
MKIKDIHLIAFYVQKPRAGVQTQIAGWNKNPDNFQYDERIEFTKGLSSKDRQYAGVILNLNEKKIVYNKFGDGKTFDDLFKYFLEGYPQYVIQTMAQLDMAYLEQFIPKEEEDSVPDVVDAPAVEDEAPKKKTKKTKSKDETTSVE